MTARVSAFIIWAAVAASIAYWGLRWLAPPTGVPSQAVQVNMGAGAHGDIRRLLVAAADAPDQTPDKGSASALAGRLRLLGVVAPLEGSQAGGLALLSIDGKPPRAVAIGSTVDGNLVLQKVSQRQIEVGPAGSPASVRLDLPALPPPATGTVARAPGLSTTANAAPTQAVPQPTGLPGEPRMPPPGGTRPGMSPQSDNATSGVPQEYR